MAFSDVLVAVRQFELSSEEPDYNEMVEAGKANLEAEARRELDAKMEKSLADYQTWASWSVEDEEPVHLYVLTMRVVFKP